ncbi:MAG: hypothetical protein ACOCP2_02290 [Halohasta sp.]
MAAYSDWESLSADPDPIDDLGYVGTEWDVVRTTQKDRSHLLFLPQEEELLRQEAFVIADESSVVDIATHR